MRTQVRVLEPSQVWNSTIAVILDSIVVSIPACHAGDRGSIPRRGDNLFWMTGKMEIDHASLISRKKYSFEIVWFSLCFNLVKSSPQTNCTLLCSSRKATKTLHRPGIEPGPPAWQASILPLNHRC